MRRGDHLLRDPIDAFFQHTPFPPLDNKVEPRHNSSPLVLKTQLRPFVLLIPCCYYISHNHTVSLDCLEKLTGSFRDFEILSHIWKAMSMCATIECLPASLGYTGEMLKNLTTPIPRIISESALLLYQYCHHSNLCCHVW